MKNGEIAYSHCAVSSFEAESCNKRNLRIAFHVNIPTNILNALQNIEKQLMKLWNECIELKISVSRKEKETVSHRINKAS